MSKGVMIVIPDRRAKFTNARLLLHPNIPKPLHGVNPRSIMGKAQWDETRRAVYPVNNFCCFACGIHKSQAYFKTWLECHEDYTIDYRKGRVVISDFVALCHTCHNFIHNGRLMMMAMRGEIPVDKYWAVMHRGFAVLKEAGLPPNPFALHTVEQMMRWSDAHDEIFPAWAGSHRFDVMLDKHPLPKGETVPWESWRLVWQGKEYKPKFPTFEDWLDHYQPGWRDRLMERRLAKFDLLNGIDNNDSQLGGLFDGVDPDFYDRLGNQD